ncbi:tumor suppressor candidate 5 homolog [Paramuricea clavata]|uniref:Tumor suppressor candidate 5 homolog n=1 Tax=Paramuricea clavata TaxID=317549 RepID=A0A6S7GRT2_PARCT|nr:tumor suppressor candidate 5 homolog [Paramuricea clavata]
MDGGSYPMQDKSWQVQGGHMPSAPPNYVANVHQPAGGIIQPHVIPYNNAHVQQPSGHTVVVVPSHAIAGNYVNDYMGLSIFSCLCCFWPVGIVAIVLSCMVGSSRREGDLEGAKNFSKWAKYLSIAAIILGVITIVSVIIIRSVVNSNSSGKN